MSEKKVYKSRHNGEPAVEVVIRDGPEAEMALRYIHEAIKKMNRRLRHNGGSGVGYLIQVKDSATSISS